jgi:hypothetical protein
LAPHQGWVAAEIRKESDSPLYALLEAGYKISPDWAVYGDAWVAPFEGRAGADVAARFRKNLDLYAGGWADTSGTYSAEVGVKYHF